MVHPQIIKKKEIEKENKIMSNLNKTCKVHYTGTFNDGTKLGFTIGKNLVIDGKQYKIAEDVSEKLGQLLKQYKS